MYSMQKLLLSIILAITTTGCSTLMNYPPADYGDRTLMYGFISVKSDDISLYAIQFSQVKPPVKRPRFYGRAFPYQTANGTSGFVFAQTYIPKHSTQALVALQGSAGNASWGYLYRGRFSPENLDPRWNYTAGSAETTYLGEFTYNATNTTFLFQKSSEEPKVGKRELLEFLKEKYQKNSQVLEKINAELETP